MLKSLAFVSLLATATAVTAQTPASPTGAAAATEQAPAPIVRSYQSTPAPQAAPEPEGGQPYPRPGRAPMPGRTRRPEQDANQTSQQILDSQPIAGVWLRSRSTAVLKTISATPQGTEIRLEHGILNVNVHQPAIHSEILIDLPGGQTSLLKDGLYTFNADTNTVRVLHGEAAAYPGTAGKSEKPIKIKEARQLAFAPTPAAPGSAAVAGTAARPKPVEAYPYELAADLLPAGDGNAYANISGSGYGYGDDGPYAYPYAAGAWGYPYGFYPYGVGIGFGYGYYGGYRGFYGGGYRGFYGGGRGFYGGGRGFRR